MSPEAPASTSTAPIPARHPRIADLLAAAAHRLAAAGIPAPRREARLLAAHALSLSQAELLANQDHAADPAPLAALVDRRAAGEPLARLVGRQGFWTLTLALNADTLIPRADSETLIEAARRHAAAPARLLDLGTGTGALLLAALVEFPAAWGLGVDRAPAASALAAANARANGLAARAAFLVADWTAPLSAAFDLILCNPPYIASADLPSLQPEVALHEPRLALDGGPDGLDSYRRLIPLLPHHLTPTGLTILEAGAGQADAIAALAAAAGLAVAARHCDLSGIERALVLHRAGKKPFGSQGVRS